MPKYSFKSQNPELNDFTISYMKVRLNLYESSKARLGNGF